MDPLPLLLLALLAPASSSYGPLLGAGAGGLVAGLGAGLGLAYLAFE